MTDDPADPILCTAIQHKQPEREQLQSDVDRWLADPRNTIKTYAMGETSFSFKGHKKIKANE